MMAMGRLPLSQLTPYVKLNMGEKLLNNQVSSQTAAGGQGR